MTIIIILDPPMAAAVAVSSAIMPTATGIISRMIGRVTATIAARRPRIDTMIDTRTCATTIAINRNGLDMDPMIAAETIIIQVIIAAMATIIVIRPTSTR